MTPEMIQALYANAGVSAPSQTGKAVWNGKGYALPQSQTQKKKKNFWLDQISTVGGIAGGIAGSFVTPIAGTAAGAGFGSGLGQAIEDIIMGEKAGTVAKNAGKEGLIGAVLGAGPIKLAKGAVGGSMALAKGASAAGAKQAASTAAMTPLRRMAGNTVLGSADDLAIKQFRLNPSQVTKLNKKLGEDTGTFIRRYGFSNVDDIAAKGIQPLQKEFDTVVSTLGQIPKAQIKSQLDSVIAPLKNSVSLQEQTLAKSIQAQADEFLKKTGNTLTGKEVLQFRQLFDDGVNYTLRGTPEFNVSKGMADALRKTLQDAADKAGLASAGGKSLKDIGMELSKLRQLDDIVSQQANLGRGSLPANLPVLLGGTMGAAAGGPIGAAGMAIGTEVVNSPIGRRAALKATEKLGSKLATTPMSQITSKGIAGRIGTMGVLSGAANQAPQQPASLEDALMSQSLENNANSAINIPSNTNPMNANNIMGSQYSQNGDMSMGYAQQNPYPRENLIYDMQRDPANADEYMKTYQMYQEIFAAPEAASAKPLSQGQQERSDLIKAIGMTEDAMAGGSINYGPIGSRVEGFKSLFNAADPETLAFKNIVSGLRAAITKARAGASLTEGELKMLRQYTPTDTDSEQVVRSKLAQLRALYGNSAPTGGTTLEDALMQAQGSYQ
jgi:hypothetical protein